MFMLLPVVGPIIGIVSAAMGLFMLMTPLPLPNALLGAVLLGLAF